MKAPARRLVAAGLISLSGAASAPALAAQSVLKITFTDTRLKNGLMMIPGDELNVVKRVLSGTVARKVR